MKSHKGLFITFEGGDGAGKTTLIEKVYGALRNKHAVCKTRAPGGTKTGAIIRDILLSTQHEKLDPRCELLLFLADRAQHVGEVILPALQAGQIVLCDRFNDSTMAYQGGARGLKTPWLQKLLLFACHEVTPVLTLYLDLDPKIGRARVHKSKGKKDKIESEDLRFHQSIRKAFHQIAKKEPHRFQILDAALPPGDVFTQAMEKIDALFKPRRK